MKDSMLAVGFRDVSNMWLQDYYQLANRLSTIAYLQSRVFNMKFPLFRRISACRVRLGRVRGRPNKKENIFDIM